MNDSLGRVQELVEVIILAMVDDESRVHIEVLPEAMHTNVLITVAPGDFGKVVGTHGYLAKSLRTLLKAVSNKLKIPPCSLLITDPRKAAQNDQ